MDNQTVYKIAIASYLHDIGKFAERAGFPVEPGYKNGNAGLYQPYYNNHYTHSHALYTAAFIEYIEEYLPTRFNKGNWGTGDSFINLAAGHHNAKTPMQWIIAVADRVSSGMDRKEFEDYSNEVKVKDYKKTRMLSIFEGIALDGKPKEDDISSYTFRYPLKRLSPKDIFPIEGDEYSALDSKSATKEYTELFEDFVASLGNISHKEEPLWFEHFDSLFMTYASNIPSATVGRTIPDISLYDHSRTTSAIASAIYLYHQQTDSMDIERIKDYEDKKFLFVTGDFYGIQDFIFAEGGSTMQAAAKLLRGRSFAVSLLSELAAHLLCTNIGLTPSSIILNAAGKFTVMAPNTTETVERVHETETQINEWFMDNFLGESSIGLSCCEVSCNNLISKGFSEFWDRFTMQSQRRKYKKIDLDNYGGPVKGYLKRFNNALAKALCPFCGKRPSSPKAENDPLLGDEEKSACNICRDHIYLGTKLVKKNLIAVTTKEASLENSLLEPIFGVYQVSLDVTGQLNELVRKRQLVKDWDISISKDGDITTDKTARFLNGYVPTDVRHVPKSFSDIAKVALKVDPLEDGENTGTEALAALKADVDNLGVVFGCGIRKERMSISRMATLSRQLNLFFTVYLPHLLSTDDRFKDIYTVFAGGDDLFVIGPWNRIIDFAGFMRDRFREYVCGNRHITISAGISLSKPNDPVLSLAKRSEEALEKSKSVEAKNAITIFGETVKWKGLETLNSCRNTINKWLDSGYINSAMLFKLNAFIEMSKKTNRLLEMGQVSIDDIECLKWRAMLRYTLVRNVGRRLKDDERAVALKEVEQSAQWLEEHGGGLKIPLWQIIYNRR
ncbi:MAG: type III-A CRISPR-associated protein Cas10/Csm1 [Nitrospirae bacterium]|uniref:type III-A CRISPR-associated protein Cas10/Csm1 n=1 Tax=Candidatus Magnetobacterium casense TaxID=1455061 RepID=UPI00058CA6AB|nr:type III-A CRISPR-associated protein Cas10/Csm1 [Candidatus Magnetobacterium casensis]MBF0337420.1 type III-A CRISPR-associated protein Cas10/Csm1 [Nitrospirota bacterium]